MKRVTHFFLKIGTIALILTNIVEYDCLPTRAIKLSNSSALIELPKLVAQTKVPKEQNDGKIQPQQKVTEVETNQNVPKNNLDRELEQQITETLQAIENLAQKNTPKPSNTNTIQAWRDSVIDFLLLTLGILGILIVIILLTYLLLLLITFLFSRKVKTTINSFNDLRVNQLQKADTSHQEQQNNQDKNNSLIGEVVAIDLVSQITQLKEKYIQIAKDIEEQFPSLQAPQGNICEESCNVRPSIAMGKIFGEQISPSIAINTNNISQEIGEISVSGTFGGATISLNGINNLLAGLRNFSENGFFVKNREINGTIQDYGDGLKLVACMEGYCWEVFLSHEHDLEKNLPCLIKRLAFCIFKDLSNQNISVLTFNKFTEALEKYQQYKKTANQDDLTQSQKLLCTDVLQQEPGYINAFSLLYNFGVTWLELRNYKNAQEMFKRAISLEPYIMKKVSDIKIPLECLKWDKTVQDTFYDTNNYRQRWHYRLTAYWNELRFNCRLWFDPSKKSNYDQIKKLASSLAEPLMGYGKALEQLGEEDKKQPQCKCDAEETYKRAIDFSQGDDRAYSNLASLLIEQGKFSQAEECLIKAINLNDSKKRNNQKSFYAYNVRGNLYHDLGDYQQAIKDYEQAIKRNSSYISAYRNLGITYADMGKFEESINSFNEAMEHLRNDQLFCGNDYANKWHAWLHNGRGWTYLLQSESDATKLYDAETDFTEATKLCDQLYTPVFNLGLVYLLKGKKDKANEQWQQGIKLLKTNNIWHQLLKALYSFAQEPSNSQKVQDIQNIFNEDQEKLIPIRLKQGLLKDALVIQRGLETSKQKDDNSINNIQKIIKSIENSFLKFELCLFYIWNKKLLKRCLDNILNPEIAELEKNKNDKNIYMDLFLYRYMIWQIKKDIDNSNNNNFEFINDFISDTKKKIINFNLSDLKKLKIILDNREIFQRNFRFRNFDEKKIIKIQLYEDSKYENYEQALKWLKDNGDKYVEYKFFDFDLFDLNDQLPKKARNSLCPQQMRDKLREFTRTIKKSKNSGKDERTILILVGFGRLW